MDISIRDEDVEVLLGDLIDVHGYDFTGYSRASLKRRLNRLIMLDRFPSFAEFRFKLKTDNSYLKRFVEEVTVNVTEMFRDADFYIALREKILPMLASRPFIRIWHAGCSTGEEVYSMAILLHEANLLHKSLIYATDINPDVLENAKKGIYALQHIRQFSENYISAGGREDFSNYYTALYDNAIFNAALRDKILFATHNLVSDNSFNEFQLILCRNVLIYFEKPLQDKVLSLFDESLETLGYIALGSKETLRFSNINSKYIQQQKQKIWKKIS